MKKKTCNKCKIEKPISEFFKRKNKSETYGIHAKCKVCQTKASDFCRLNINVDEKKAKRKLYEQKNYLNRRTYAKTYSEKFPEKIKERWRKYYQKNKEKLKLSASTYAKENRKKITVRVNEKHKKRVLIDSFYKLKHTLRSRMNSFMIYKKVKKKLKSQQLLGADFDVVKKHLEKQFKKGMTWDNHGRHTWHIDHIIPLASAKNEEELITLFHYTNLQPLLAKDNLLKKDKISQIQMKIAI